MIWPPFLYKYFELDEINRKYVWSSSDNLIYYPSPSWNVGEGPLYYQVWYISFRSTLLNNLPKPPVDILHFSVYLTDAVTWGGVGLWWFEIKMKEDILFKFKWFLNIFYNITRFFTWCIIYKCVYANEFPFFLFFLFQSVRQKWNKRHFENRWNNCLSPHLLSCFRWVDKASRSNVFRINHIPPNMPYFLLV